MSVIGSNVLAGSSGSAARGTDVALGHSTTPYVSVYKWTNEDGFGTKYSNPATLPAGQGYGVAFSPSGNDLAVAHLTSPYITVYPWSSSGFGTKYSNPASLPSSTGKSVDWHPDGNDIVVGHNNSPYMSGYPWTSGTGFGTKYSAPAGVNFTGNVEAVRFHPSGNHVVNGGAGTIPLGCYPFTSGTGFGSRDVNQSSPGGSIQDLNFSSDGTYIAFGHFNTPYVKTGTFVGTSGSAWVTYHSNPSSLPPSHGNGVDFSPDDNVLVVGHYASPFITAYSFSTSLGTKYSNPSSLPTNRTRPRFSADGTVIMAASIDTPYIEAWEWDNASGWGTKYSNPSTLVTGAAYEPSFRPTE